jgi:Fibronectin type III domain
MNTLSVVALLLCRDALAQPFLPNPGPVTVSVTQTSAKLSWPPVPEATYYNVWRPKADGTYGQRWEVFMTVTDPTVEFTGLQPGTRAQVQLTTDDNLGMQGGGTKLSFRTLMPPVWRSTPVSSFDRGAIYSVLLEFDGEPQPQVSFLEAPAGMFFEYSRGGVQTGWITWNGNSSQPVNLTLRLQNSLAEVADLSIVLTPSNAAPIYPPMTPEQVIATADDHLGATVFGFTPSEARLYVKRPGVDFFTPAGKMTLVSAGVYAACTATEAGEHVFQVLVRNAATGRYVWSNPVAVVRQAGRDCATWPVANAPESPTSAQAVPYGSTIHLTWVDNSATEDAFRVERSTDGGLVWTTALTTHAKATFSSDYGAALEQPVCYRVIAFNAAGDSPPSDFDCTTPPSPPTGLTAAGVDGYSIDLKWTDNSAVEDGYQIERTDGIEAYSVVAQLPANSTGYRDVGLNSNWTYQYRVRASSDGGFSEFSNITSATAATAPPAAPVDANAWPGSSSTVFVVWTDSSINEDGFGVERSTDGGGTWTPVTSVNPHQFVDTGLAGDRQVCYRVIAFNSQGDSPPSNTDCVTPPLAPTDLAVTALAGTEVEITWTDNSSVEDGYEVWVTTSCAEQPNFAIGGLPADSNRYVGVPGVALCEIVGYSVMATKDGGYSDPVSAPAPL